MILSAEKLNASYQLMNVINSHKDQEKDSLDESIRIINEPCYMFSRVGDKIDIDLHVRDIVNSNIEKGLQIKYPICFECYDRILDNLQQIIGQQSSSMTTYAKELS